MQYKNATQAAIEIGISYRTMRRRIEEGKIEAIRGEDGQYSIAVSEVERLKKAQSERPKLVMGGQQTASDERPDLEQRVADLEQRVRTLEDMVSHERPSTEPQAPLYRYKTDREETATAKPQNRTTDVPATLPPGMLSASDFAKLHGIEYENMKNYIRRGVNGEQLEVTEVPHPIRANYTQKYLNPQQQQAAIELLRRHKKL